MGSVENLATRPPADSSGAGGDLPRHIAVIMDGNGRWAQSRGLPRIEGHRHGVHAVRRVTEAAARLGAETLTLYCLSSENWRRPKHELDFLMHLMEQFLIEERRTLTKHGFQLQVIGRKDRLPETVVREMKQTEKLAEANQGMRIVLAIDYGGRQEIAFAARRLAQQVAAGKLDPDAVDEQLLTEQLDTAGIADPDLLIRTGGEMRVSNFLLWQISYAEIWVTEKLWPDFDGDDLRAAIDDYARRHRRFGGL